jgi:hypothetical protein
LGIYGEKKNRKKDKYVEDKSSKLYNLWKESEFGKKTDFDVQ